ncbi:MAG TPA: aldolase [bacterium]|nr:aldolase [bacterium]HPT29645.1 aldolase [bacterium]
MEIPLDVPSRQRRHYKKNYKLATQNSGRLFLFAGDQKVEHLNQDFVGKNISAEDQNPEHLFKIAKEAKVGVFAAQWGLISQYGKKYRSVPYLVKLNSRTNLMPTKAQDPISLAWTSVSDVIKYKKETGLKIVGVGYTVYIGGERESEILQEAAQIVQEAHEAGLITVIWMYPRGKNIKNEEDINLIAGGAGVALCLGSDFVKVKYPYTGKIETAKEFLKVTQAAGKTKVICAGGSKLSPAELLKNMSYQLHISQTGGTAIGRNLHQYPLATAVQIAKAIKALVIKNKDLKTAKAILGNIK